MFIATLLRIKNWKQLKCLINSWQDKCVMVWTLSKEKRQTSGAPTTSCCAKEASQKRTASIITFIPSSSSSSRTGQINLWRQKSVPSVTGGEGAEGDLAGYGEAPYVPPCTGWRVTQVYTVAQSVCWSLLRMSCPIATLVNWQHASHDPEVLIIPCDSVQCLTTSHIIKWKGMQAS